MRREGISFTDINPDHPVNPVIPGKCWYLGNIGYFDSGDFYSNLLGEGGCG